MTANHCTNYAENEASYPSFLSERGAAQGGTAKGYEITSLKSCTTNEA
jgi:hypothetical protein